MDPLEILGAISYYTYQSCEHKGWPDSAACAITEKMTTHTLDILRRAQRAARLAQITAKPFNIPVLLPFDDTQAILALQRCDLYAFYVPSHTKE